MESELQDPETDAVTDCASIGEGWTISVSQPHSLNIGVEIRITTSVLSGD
jgi:hypothetical protein